MRALLAGLILVLAPASALGKPLDADRSFARNGIFLRSQSTASYSVVAHPDGGTLHATYEGLLRLSAAGKRLPAPVMTPAGAPHTLLPGLAVGVSTPIVYGEQTPVAVWRTAPDGTALAHHAFLAPGGRSSSAEQAVSRGRQGYALLIRVSRSDEYSRDLRVAALTPDGALDTTWGDQGFHRIGPADATIGGGPDGSVVIATDRTPRCVSRKVRPVLRVQRLGRDGTLLRTRRHVLGGNRACTAGSPGDIDVDRRGRVTISGGLGPGGSLLRLRRDLRRDRRFGRNGVVRITSKPTWWMNMALEPRPGGGFGVGYTTTGRDDVPHAHVALVSERGRVVASRRLRVTRAFPTSDLHDIAFDRRRRLVAAGSLRDTDVFIREDYGQPHLAVWRLRTTG